MGEDTVTQRVPKSIQRAVEQHQRDGESFADTLERLYGDMEAAKMEVEEYNDIVEDNIDFKTPQEEPQAEIEYVPEVDEYPEEQLCDDGEFLIGDGDGVWESFDPDEHDSPDAYRMEYDDGYTAILTSPWSLPAAFKAEVTIPEGEKMWFHQYLGSIHPRHGWIDDYETDGVELRKIVLRLGPSGLQQPTYEVHDFVRDLRSYHQKNKVVNEMQVQKWNAADGDVEDVEVELPSDEEPEESEDTED